MSTVQRFAALTLEHVLAGRSLNEQLPLQLKHAEPLAPSERAALRDLSYGSLRHYGELRTTLDSLVKKPLTDPFIDALLIIALYQLTHTRTPDYAIVDGAVKVAATHAGHLKSLVNGVLRSFQRQRDELTAALKHQPLAYWNHPEWWINDMRQTYRREWKAILKANQLHPPMTLRINRHKTNVSTYLQQLHAANIEAISIENHPDAVQLLHPVNVTQLPFFAEGHCSVQDASAQQAAARLECHAGHRVLDACAAPGGKTSHLLEMYDGLDVTALELDTQRLQRIHDNLQRLGLHAHCIQGDATQPQTWWDQRPFDRILADVPCSASGIVRRQPDIKWTRKPTDILNFAQQQKQILDALWPLLTNGGKLLYATCSVFSAENDRQINHFLKRHANARIINTEQILPDAVHDGFYYALIEKT